MTCSTNEVSNAAYPNVVFVAAARAISRDLKSAGYATDEYGLGAIYIPTVYRDADSARFLAGYSVSGSLGDPAQGYARSVVDATATYRDAAAAAISADRFADDAAARNRVVRPAAMIASARARARPRQNEAVAAVVRSACGAA